MTTADDARFWDRTARRYARSTIADPVGYERSLARTRNHLRPDDHILELGCGTGTTALLLAQDGGRYLATDISEGMIAIADAKVGPDTPRSLVFRRATVDELAREPARFDVVLGFNLLHLVRDLPQMLRTVHDLLKPGGLFISKTPCLGDMNPLLSWVLLPVMRAVRLAPHVDVFRATALERLLREAGFTIRSLESHAGKGADRRPYVVAERK